ncbi:MAG TPA: antibiotic biosynthesis monooxygenase family protein [Flavobacterium sp.]|nr:antibiotic biosynthesis monooxygenase family protein [Flavobacterium sp.]
MSKEIGGIKNIVVREGKIEEFEDIFFEMLKEIRKNEPGNIYYDLYKSKTDKNGYIVMERYKDKAAWELHQNSPHGKTYFLKIRAILESVHVEYFDAKDGTKN